MDTNALESVGFTKGEIKVYLALLKLGETTTGSIIKKSNITGSKVYEILQKLIDKGLVSYIIKEKTKYFQASSPKRILDYLKGREVKFFNDKKKIEKIVLELESINESMQITQTSQIFEGFDGMRTVFNLILESLKKGEEYYAFSLGEELKNKNFLLFLHNYHQKRIRRKIKVKIIANLKERSLFRGLSKLKNLQIRYYQNPVPLGLIIFEKYVATFTFKDKSTVFLIKSEQITNSYKDFFNGLWKRSKR